MGELQFLDDEVIHNSIECGPLPNAKTIFESDLLCDEFIEAMPGSNPLSFPEENFLASPLPNHFHQSLLQTTTPPQSPSCSALPSTSLPPTLPPLPPSPPRATALDIDTEHHYEENHTNDDNDTNDATHDNDPTDAKDSNDVSQPRLWRSFLDEDCPLRKRVKVTITPQARGKRVAPTPQPSLAHPAKKSRMSTSPNSRNPPRRLQTTLCLSRSPEDAGRLMLHIPTSQEEQPMPHNPICTGNIPQSSPTLNLPPLANILTQPDEAQFDSEPHYIEDMPLPEHINMVDANGDFLYIEDEPGQQVGEEAEQDTIFRSSILKSAQSQPAQPSQPSQPSPRSVKAPPMRPRVYTARRNTNSPSDTRSAGGKSRPLINSDLARRLSKMYRSTDGIGLGKTAPAQPPVEKDRGSSLPLVSAAVRAVANATQKYASLVNKVSSTPPASTLTQGWLVPRVSNDGKQKPSSSTGKAITPFAIGQISRPGKRKRGRKRKLLSFNDREVAPLVDNADGSSFIGLDDNVSPLMRYLQSPCDI